MAADLWRYVSPPTSKGVFPTSRPVGPPWQYFQSPEAKSCAVQAARTQPWVKAIFDSQGDDERGTGHSILETETHALSLHTQREVCRLKNSATSSTTPQGRPAWIAFPQLLYNIFFIAACANVSFLMLVSLCKHLKRGRQGLERIAYLTSLTKSYSVTLSTDSSIPSTTFPLESY